MKEFLEGLEIGEGKVKLSKEEIKSVLAEHGKTVTTEKTKVEDAKKIEIETLNNTITDLNNQIKDMPNSDDVTKLKSTIADYEKAEAERKEQEKAESKEADFKTRYINVLGEKEFINEYTGNDFYRKFKENLELKENKGKGDKEVFEAMTKDVADLFKNPNPDVGTPSANPSANAKGGLNKASETASIISEFSRMK